MEMVPTLSPQEAETIAELAERLGLDDAETAELEKEIVSGRE